MLYEIIGRLPNGGEAITFFAEGSTPDEARKFLHEARPGLILDLPKPVEIGNYIQDLLRASGPATLNEICAELVTQAPGVNRSNAKGLAQEALTELISENIIIECTVTGWNYSIPGQLYVAYELA